METNDTYILYDKLHEKETELGKKRYYCILDILNDIFNENKKSILKYKKINKTVFDDTEYIALILSKHEDNIKKMFNIDINYSNIDTVILLRKILNEINFTIKKHEVENDIYYNIQTKK